MKKHQLDFVAVTEGECVTIGELKERFYRIMRVTKKELRRGHKKDELVIKPISLISNPPGWNSTISDPIWIVVYPGHFYLRVECGRHIMTGPHKMELCFQVRRGNHIKLGCWLAMFPFHNDHRLLKSIKKAVLMEKFFCTELTAKMLIELGDEQETELI